MDYALFTSVLAATMVIVATPGSTVARASSKAVRFGPRAAFVTVLDELSTRLPYTDNRYIKYP